MCGTVQPSDGKPQNSAAASRLASGDRSGEPDRPALTAAPAPAPAAPPASQRGPPCHAQRCPHLHPAGLRPRPPLPGPDPSPTERASAGPPPLHQTAPSSSGAAAPGGQPPDGRSRCRTGGPDGAGTSTGDPGRTTAQARPTPRQPPVRCQPSPATPATTAGNRGRGHAAAHRRRAAEPVGQSRTTPDCEQTGETECMDRPR